MPRRPRSDDGTATLTTLASVALVVAILYAAQDVLLPIAVAVLIAFILTPLASWLERVGAPRIPAVLAAVALAFAILGGVAWVVTDELVELARNAPNYQETLVRKIRGLKEAPVGGDLLGQLTTTAENLGRELSQGAAPARPGTPGDVSGLEPMPVRIVEGSPLALRLLRDWLGPLLSPLGTAALVLVFVVFILLSREDLRDRLIRLAGTGRVYVTTQAFDEAGARISRYLLLQLVINASYGVAVAIGLAVIGVPSAALWGLLATVMRFVPYVGPWIAALLPILLSLAVFEGWSRPVATVAFFAVLELVSNNVMEPWLYGTSTGVSTVGIIASAVFWTWLWGPLGLVLSMPLTVCLTVLGRHVPRLAFLDVLLSDQPALELKVRFYQRLLALDFDEACDLVEQSTRRASLDEVYDQVFLPALSLAERDRHEGHLTPEQAAFVHRSMRDLIASAERQVDTSSASETIPPGAAASTAAEPDAPASRALAVLCVAAEDEADRLASTMLAALLEARGHQPRTSAPRRGEDEPSETPGLRPLGAPTHWRS